MSSRVPPQDLKAEKAVLGAMLIESTVIPEVASLLNPGDFYFESHRKIYEAMLALWNRREPVDLITVSVGLLANIRHRNQQANQHWIYALNYPELRQISGYQKGRIRHPNRHPVQHPPYIHRTSTVH